jgi:hypothetical protein
MRPEAINDWRMRTGAHRPRTDHGALAAELRAAMDGEVRFDAGSRALYATDGSNYRQAPIGVVIPRNKEDIVNVMAAVFAAF